MTPRRNWYSWTEEEFNFIRLNFMKMTDEEMADKLGRSKFGTAQKRMKLRLFRKPIEQEFKYIKLKNLSNLRKAVLMSKIINRMEVLIFLCQNTTNNYKRDQFKQELRKLSGIK